MKRIASIGVVLALVAAFVVLAGGIGGNSAGHEYWVEMDNAFGLVSGGDLKIAGVRAGKISDIKLDRRTNRALIGFTISQAGFGSLRQDVTCESRPQSLIGEYYLECEPGSSPHLLSDNSQSNPIPVTQTDSTIAPDLVQDILRAPYSQRLSLILGELGAGVGGNGANLNAAIRRAIPALRETDAVLSTLAGQNRILADLTDQADTVLHDLAVNRSDVQRFIGSAKGAATDTAAEQAALAQGFARLPHFLAELRPAMAALGNVAVSATPTLHNLDASSPQLHQLLTDLGPFASASTPAFASLGQASVTGDQAVKAATPTIAQLNTFSAGTPELAQNLSIVLNHLNNPAYGSDKDPRAVPQHPVTHSDTYTGLESLLQYVFDQANDTTYYSADGHMLALATLVDPTTCSPFADAAAAIKYPQCRAWLGPTQPGVTTPDPTKRVASATTPAAQPLTSGSQQPASTPAAPPTTSSGGGGTTGSGGSGGSGGKTCVAGVCVPVQVPPVKLPPVKLPPVKVPPVKVPPVNLPLGSSTTTTTTTTSSTTTSSSSSSTSLLNYLLGP